MPWRNDATPRNTVKAGNAKTSELNGKAGVLHGSHMGGHTDVSAIETKLASYGLKPTSKSDNVKAVIDPKFNVDINKRFKTK
jgi:hypothetical protein